MLRRACLALAIAMTAGCHIGRNPQQLALAREPRGAEISLSTAATEVEGELLAVEEPGLTIVSARRILLVPFDRLRSVRSTELRVVSRGGYPLSGLQREQLRLHARYPQGIDDALLRRLLDAYGQSERTVVD